MEYAQTLGIVIDPAASLPMRLPLVVYSHGLTGSPISKGYVQVMVELAAHGFMVAAVFHGDPRFSRVRIGTSFYVQPVNASLACPDGYLGVQRAYNNGFVRNDSNHRFTSSDSEMREMARKG